MEFLPLINTVIAQSGQQQGQQSMLLSWLPIVLIFFIFYFLLIRPQQKKEKERQNMLGALKHDDEVITSGGIHGKITNLTDQVVTLEIAQNVRIKVSRSAIAGLRALKKENEK